MTALIILATTSVAFSILFFIFWQKLHLAKIELQKERNIWHLQAKKIMQLDHDLNRTTIRKDELERINRVISVQMNFLKKENIELRHNLQDLKEIKSEGITLNLTIKPNNVKRKKRKLNNFVK